jgi:hypothetical protein
MNPSISSVREVEVECSDQALWESHSSLLIHYYDAASLLRCSIPGDLFLFSLLEFISLRNPWEIRLMEDSLLGGLTQMDFHTF